MPPHTHPKENPGRRILPKLNLHTIDAVMLLVVLTWTLSLFLDPPFEDWYGRGIAVPTELVYLLVGGSLGLRVPAPKT